MLCSLIGSNVDSERQPAKAGCLFYAPPVARLTFPVMGRYPVAMTTMADTTPSSASVPNLTNELARERNREAADRTLLAWIRTSLAMISLGFGIERLGQAALSLDGKAARFSLLKTQVFGASLILLGIVATLAGMWEHRGMLAAIRREDYRYSDRLPIARIMGWAIVLVGAAALVAMLGT